MTSYILRAALCLGLLAAAPLEASAKGEGASGEAVLQQFFKLWGRDEGVTSASVDRLYAPQVVYYGKRFSRREVLAEKLRFARHWPRRDYSAVPGTVTTRCGAQGSHCVLRATIAWHRETSTGVASSGKALLKLEFTVTEGNRKIVREQARLLGPSAASL